MKKALAFAVAAMVAAITQAATVGWSASSIGAGYNGDAYKLFVIGQNGVTGIDQITGLLDNGKSVDDYAFGGGTVSNGRIQVSTSSSGKTLDPGTYTSFMVLFDNTPTGITSGTSKYVVFSGGENQTKTFDATAATVTFGAGNVGTVVNNANNWSTYGAVPEPTSVALLALGLAALGLKRKVA